MGEKEKSKTITPKRKDKRVLKSKRREIRLSPKDDEKLCANAKRANLSVSAYLRKIIMGSIVTVQDQELKLDTKKLINEINKIGVNINQIVRNNNSEFYSEYEKMKLFALAKKLNENMESIIYELQK